MRWLPSISFSSSGGTSSSSSRSSPVRGGDAGERRSAEDNVRGGGWRFGSRVKITRQRKSRHLSDRNAPGMANLRSSSGYDKLPARSSSTSGIPQPLPLPEFLPGARWKERGATRSSASGDFDRPLPSPKAGPSRGIDDRERDRAENAPIRSIFSVRDKRKNAITGQSETRAAWRGRQNENGSDNFRVEVPIRSAPTSPLESPALSPQRPSFDLVPYHLYMVPRGNQVWSAPEMPTTDMMSGLPPPAFYDCSALSTDCSPSSSPPSKNICQLCRSPNGSSSPFPARLSFETASARRENSVPVEVHPLPLPPGAITIHSPSSSIPQVATKPEPVPMKSQWQKGKLIGRGTFGSVYVASNRETGALCAMKEVELFPDDPKSAESIKQLQQEINVLSQLKHQNIVQYYGSEIVEDKFYIYLEYVHPGSINKYVREHCGAITESVVRNFTRHILSGLAYLHSTKTIHRDIKGANLLVDSSGVVKLADFGMAKHLTGQVVDLSMKGSPYWMAPELMQAMIQKDNSSDLALAVDIWSLGCTIVEMLTGKPPWSEYEGAAAMFKVLKDTPPIPETLSSEGKDFLQCCFRRNPADRPTAAMLLEHRFLKNSHLMDVPSCTHAFSGLNLMDKPHSPTTERSENKLSHQNR